MLSKAIGSTALRAGFQASVLALALTAVAGPASARSAFDGDWSVLIQTRGGACEPAVRYGVQISNGQVIAGGGQASVQGRVAPNGAVRVSVQAGGQWANGSGRLGANRGGGVWRGQGSAGACSGTWVAERRSYGAEAQAEVPQRPVYNYAPNYAAPRYYQPYYGPRYYMPAPGGY